MNLSLRNILLLLLFFILQIIWFNHIQLFGKYTPVIYIFPLLLMPIQKDETFYLLLAFVLGLSIDLLTNTGGVFAATAVLVVYLRKIFFIISKNQSQDLNNIKVANLSLGQKIIYYFFFIFISQIFMYFLESFNLQLVLSKFSYILINSLITLLFFLFIDLLFFNPQRK